MFQSVKRVIKYTISTKNSNYITNCKNDTNPFNIVGFTLLRIVKLLLLKDLQSLEKNVKICYNVSRAKAQIAKKKIYIPQFMKRSRVLFPMH